MDCFTTIKQITDYDPFGMSFTSTQSSANKYLYNGKELQDEQLGGVNLDWYDYHSRFYDPALARFTTQDPLAEDFSSWTPYHYVHNNPINLVDPTGMSADGYTVDMDGYLQKVNNEGRDENGKNQYDVIYAKGEYSSEKKKDYDETGEKTGLQISSGIIQSKKTVALVRNADGEGNPTGAAIPVDMFKINDDSEAKTIHQFLDKKTNVEWSNTCAEKSNGESQNILITSHRWGKVHSGHANKFLFNNKYKRNYSNDHNQPDKPGPSPADRGFARRTSDHFPGAKFRILFKGKYYPYKSE